MDDKKLTEADLKLWEEYTKRIASEGDKASPVYKSPPVINLKDYLNDSSNFPEQRKIKKQHNRYDAKLDLHGMTRNEAHKALETFLCREKLRGSKCVLIITGKGHGKGEGLGILKRKVPLWLEVSNIARSWSTAAQSDGGDGALYVKLIG